MHQRVLVAPAWRPGYWAGHIGRVQTSPLLLALVPVLGFGTGSNAAFIPLVFLHAVSALVAFGSIGFAGTYASRAAHMAAFEGTLQRTSAGAPGQVGHAAAGPGSAAEVVAGPASTPAGPEAPVDPEVEELLRYFRRPARFWKVMLLVPVFGIFALLNQPNNKGLDQVWTIGALLIWLVAVIVAAGVVAPALRQLGEMLPKHFQWVPETSPGPGGGAAQVGQPGASASAGTTASTGASASASTTAGTGSGADDRLQAVARAALRARLSRAGSMASRGAAVCDLLFFGALALMIWQP
jgi:hypothetical protein